jgi:hypothetical protein
MSCLGISPKFKLRTISHAKEINLIDPPPNTIIDFGVNKI